VKFLLGAAVNNGSKITKDSSKWRDAQSFESFTVQEFNTIFESPPEYV